MLNGINIENCKNVHRFLILPLNTSVTRSISPVSFFTMLKLARVDI